ncbi:MAG: ABC transporter ATP-binding protein, partial [Gammaproteobacteria bacterium]|nr:ABC transporter ATP-binding protein [Gammaproteobacteria bacterium]
DIVAVDDVSLEVWHGEVVALLGPSGSGKTTLLMLIGGQVHPDEGDILLAGQSVENLPPNKIDTATVFQEYALFPHMTVGENVAFGLRMRRVPPAEIERRVAEVLALVGLQGFESRDVVKLSGGQRQRVATARALVVHPRVLLMDEPLSALDLQIRTRLQKELRDLLKRVNVTTIIVTHDQKEAFALADRVAVMNAGRVEQIGRPADLYHSPASAFVASFLGGGMLLDAVAVGHTGEFLTVRIAGAQIAVRGNADVGTSVTVLLRPEDLLIRIAGDDTEATWRNGQIVDVLESGETTRYTAKIENIELAILELGMARFERGEEVTVTASPGRGVVVKRD